MRKFVAAIFLAAFVACGGDSSTNPSASIAGTYTLRTVNGSALPFTVYSDVTTKIEVTDDAITLNDGGTFTESGHTRTTTNGRVTTESIVDAGTYVRNGTAITLKGADGTPTPGSLNGSSLTLTDTGISAVYSK